MSSRLYLDISSQWIECEWESTINKIKWISYFLCYLRARTLSCPYMCNKTKILHSVFFSSLHFHCVYIFYITNIKQTIKFSHIYLYIYVNDTWARGCEILFGDNLKSGARQNPCSHICEVASIKCKFIRVLCGWFVVLMKIIIGV